MSKSVKFAVLVSLAAAVIGVTPDGNSKNRGSVE
jgi:hypothetical protein